MKQQGSILELVNRRGFLGALPYGLGATAMALTNPATAGDLTPHPSRFPGTAKRVVHLFMNGGPSQVDTFDPKPLLDKYHGKPVPEASLRTEDSGRHAFAF